VEPGVATELAHPAPHVVARLASQVRAAAHPFEFQVAPWTRCVHEAAVSALVFFTGTLVSRVALNTRLLPALGALNFLFLCGALIKEAIAVGSRAHEVVGVNLNHMLLVPFLVKIVECSFLLFDISFVLL